MTKLLSRKDIAALTGLSVKEVSANEIKFGLADKSIKVRINARNIKYHQDAALALLKKAGLLPARL